MMKYSLFRLLVSVFFYFSLSNIVYAGSLLDKPADDLLIEKEPNGSMPSLQRDWTIKPFPFYHGMTLMDKNKDPLQVNTVVTFPTLFDMDLSTFAGEYTLPHSMPFLDTMMNTSEELVAATKVKESGLSINIPLSIVNMPINVGVLSNVMHSTLVSLSNDLSLPANTMGKAKDLSYQTAINLDMQLSMVLADNVQLAFTGRHLFSQSQFLMTHYNDRQYNTSNSMLTAGVVYDWNKIHFSTEIDLYRQADWDEAHSAQFWRVGGDLSLFSWLDVNLHYYYNVTSNRESLYSMGSEFKFGDKFSVDFSGIYRQSNHIEGLLITSYDF